MRKITTGVILICLLVGSSLLFAGGGPNVNGAKLYIKQNNLEKAIGVLLKEVEERRSQMSVAMPIPTRYPPPKSFVKPGRSAICLRPS